MRTPEDASRGLERDRGRRDAAELIVASFVVLFQELALIRWFPGQIRVLAYFPNLVLISAFLGLGVGALRQGKRSLLALWPISLLAITAVGLGLGRVAITHQEPSEWLWLFYYDLGPEAPVYRGVRLPILLCFVLSAASFVPLGQFVAERLESFRRRGAPLWGYSFDLGGSLLGVLAFALASFLLTFPVVWFAVFLGMGLLLPFGNNRRRMLYGLAAIGVVALVAAAERAEEYSPYYGLSVQSADGSSSVVLTNGLLHQVALSVGSDAQDLRPGHEAIREGFHLPYELLQRPVRNVLVLGAGTGNDVAVALDEGAETVDAVEIDPSILELGRRIHPDRPYDSSRVRVHTMDARAFLNSTSEKYDLIVFGTLDSQTRLSALSNVRLDNFVYTVECLRAARDRLTEDGGLVMNFAVNTPYIEEHLVAALYRAFEHPPVRIERHHLLFTRIFLAGEGFRHLAPEFSREQLELFEGMKAPTDDWPFLYLRGRAVSRFYLELMGLILLVSVVGVGVASREMRQSLLGFRGVDLEMFLYGVAFLLLETRFVTEMNLVWGATWLTSAVVFGSILAMLLVSTIWMQRAPMPFGWAAGGLLATLMIAYFVPASVFVGTSTGVRLVASLAYVGTPIFFAAACFALRFRERSDVALAFGWNLLGAVVGGLVEFLGMALGLRALFLVGILAYLLSFLLVHRGGTILLRREA